MYKALYRDFRPDRFEELIGQDHIVKILKSQIASGSTSHAYLFCGTRGTGKTTTARILAKALNCRNETERPCCECDACLAIRDGSFIDVVEIDAASNNGVDNIRDLRDNINYPPVSGRYKVFIIDEVHMLSAGAFNALLKTLEEPPSYVVFIMATTEPQKIPATILSRCVRLDFRRVSEQMLVDNMKHICQVRGVEAEDAALALIAINADGSVRDSLSILEQCIFPGEVLRRDDVAQILGTAGEEALIALTEAVRMGNASGALLQLDSMISSGIDVKLLMKQWLEHFRNLLLVKYVQDPGQMLSMSMENARRVGAQAADVSTAFLDRAVRELTETISGTRWSSRPRVMLEMSAVKLCASQETEEAFRLRYDGASAARIGSEGAADFRGTVSRNQERPGAEASRQITRQSAAETLDEPPVPVPTDNMDRYVEPPVPEPPQYYEESTEPPVPDVYADSPVLMPELQEYFEELQDIEDPQNIPEPPFFGEEPRAAEPSARERSTKPEPKTKSSTSSSAAEPDDRIWQEVLDEAASRHGLFTRFINRSHLTRTDGDIFFIRCESEQDEQFLGNRGRETAEELVSKRMGRPMRMAFDAKGRNSRKPEEKQTSLSDHKAELEKFFGMPVEVE